MVIDEPLAAVLNQKTTSALAGLASEGINMTLARSLSDAPELMIKSERSRCSDARSWFSRKS